MKEIDLLEDDDTPNKSDITLKGGDYIQLGGYSQNWLRYVKTPNSNRTLISVRNGNVWSGDTCTSKKPSVKKVENVFGVIVDKVVRNSNTRLVMKEAIDL